MALFRKKVGQIQSKTPNMFRATIWEDFCPPKMAYGWGEEITQSTWRRTRRKKSGSGGPETTANANFGSCYAICVFVAELSAAEIYC